MGNYGNGVQTNLYTSGGEYTCQQNSFPGCGTGPNNTYVGPMHYHPEKGYMGGAQHSNTSHPTLIAINKKGGRIKKKNAGGYLHGPSHEQGGIAANVGGNEIIELEGGEYIINAQTVNAVGTQFLDELNSTQTSYHQGGFQPGQLPGSNYRRGGRVRGGKYQYSGRVAGESGAARGRARVGNPGECIGYNSDGMCVQYAYDTISNDDGRNGEVQLRRENRRRSSVINRGRNSRTQRRTPQRAPMSGRNTYRRGSTMRGGFRAGGRVKSSRNPNRRMYQTGGMTRNVQNTRLPANRGANQHLGTPTATINGKAYYCPEGVSPNEFDCRVVNIRTTGF